MPIRVAILSLLFAVAGAVVPPTAVVAPGSDPVATAAESHPMDDAFDRNVAPLFGKRCLGCHSGAEPKGGLDLSRRATALKGGDSGRAIVPGKPKDSLLWQRISAAEMPPKKPLPKAERAVLKAWIAGGAKWGSDPIDPFRFTSDSRAGYDWWALQPVKRPGVPDVSPFRANTATARNPIDAFIRCKLHEKGLSPSAEADRRTLIRRVTFDLLGLPPTRQEVDAFLADRSPDAYERLVDRLLASPQFGERWARHWLDVARFGESQGFERDKLRTNSWRYRDWVVRAFNEDMPFDRFARWQIAGDVMRPGNAQAIVATGFLVAGPWDEVGQNQQSAAMKAVVRQDELEDYVSTVGQAFLGLTIHCARCHDHKFDPIRQEEYYRLTSDLAGVHHGERNIASLPTRREADARRAALAARIDSLRRRIDAMEANARRKVLAGRKPRKPIEPPTPIAAWDFCQALKADGARPAGLDVTLHGKAKRDSAGLHLDGKTAYARTPPLEFDLVERTLEAWVQLDNLKQRGGGVVSLQKADGSVFDAIVFGELEPGKWMAGSDHFRRTSSFDGPAEKDAAQEAVHVAIVWTKDGTVRGYRNGRPYGEAYRTGNKTAVKFAGGTARIVFGLRHSPPGGNKMLAGRIERARLYDRALSSREVAASAGVSADFVTAEELTAALTPAQRKRRDDLRFEIGQLKLLAGRWKETKAYAVVPKSAPTAHLLKRGNPADQGKVVTPGAVAAVSGVRADFQLQADAPEAERRIRLAEWVADEHNPLFARVIVNRLWHYHFGRGIVNTPSDFGFNGGRPTHPELLDWLAAELKRSHWSLKHIQRLIVTSATYRQSSRIPHPQSAIPDPQSIDADNRYLWRMSPRRLEAEAVRDAILSVSGELNAAIGGPGFYEFTTFNSNSQFYVMREPTGRTFNRRSLYRTWVRSARSRFLDAFDCPDPSTKTPRRAVTITPLQALVLSNNAFVLRMSDRFADRLRREAGEDAKHRVQRCWHIAYGRPPDATELRRTVPFVKQHGLAALCRVVFNSNEFLFAD